MEPFLVISKGRMVKVKENGKNAAKPIKFCCPGMYSGAAINNGRLYMKIMNRCAKAQCAAAGVLRLYPVGCADAGRGWPHGGPHHPGHEPPGRQDRADVCTFRRCLCGR